ncbi:YibE/F family protein [Alkalibaculum sp. M08DMB]|uniref:YibE/F family protein n=1 Tax=Alkalibaculum sporogenes TaxID=2655001 RepID=A0A6A7K9R4_9FIRM|nr:YibE/F family protein [Alkalibaculum sporogenes]MPW26105.1 YibE/F family protein [Alkalibaculum sporogenes]
MRKLVLIILFLLILSPSIALAQEYEYDPEYDSEYDYYQDDSMVPIHSKGQVLEIIDEELDIDIGGGLKVAHQTLKVKITNGPFKDQVITTENSTSGNVAYDMWLVEGDKVLLYLETTEDGELVEGYVMDFVRDTYLLAIIAIFILVLIIVGKMKGLKSVFTLGFTLLIIGKFLLPLLFKGYNPVLLALLSGFIIATVTFLVVAGRGKKSIAAILGTTGGLLTAVLISIIIGKMANLRGLSGEEAQMLMYIPQEIQFNFQGLLFAGIMIGALGAVMDVSISIASAMEEIKNVGNKLNFREMFKSGMNVGKDIMGTMSNTLILAYTGTSIPLLLLLMAYDEPISKLINMEFLATEVIRALSGSIGLILSIPITAFIAAILMNTNNKS